jgi:hypothetical protein
LYEKNTCGTSPSLTRVVRTGGVIPMISTRAGVGRPPIRIESRCPMAPFGENRAATLASCPLRITDAVGLSR